MSATLRRQVSLLGLILAALLLPSASLSAQDEASFGRQLDSIKKLGRKKKWAEQIQGINSLLKEHEGKAYVRARRSDIEEEMRTASFRTQNQVDSPQDVLAGKVKSYNRFSAKIKVRYEDHELKPVFKNGYCPLVFSGPFAFTIKGKNYPGKSTASITLNGQGSLTISAGGRKYPGRAGKKAKYFETTFTDFRRLKNGRPQRKSLSRNPSPFRLNKPFTIAGKCTASHVEFKLNGKRLGYAKKSRMVFGRFRLRSPNVDYVEVEGQIDRAWLESLFDTRRRTLLATFSKSYDSKKVLPAWLFKSAPTANIGATLNHEAIPGPKVEGIADEIKRVKKAIEASFKGKRTLKAAMAAAMKTIDDDKLPKIIQLWLRGTTKARLGDLEGALAENSELLDQEPQFDRGRLERANYFQRLKNNDRCRKILAELTLKYPDDPEVIYQTAFLHLITSENDQGRTLLRDAIGRGIANKKILDFDRILVKAEKGPSWTRQFEIKSQHYIVRSNMSRDICVEASRVLEKAYLAYKAYLPARASDTTERFPVYIFVTEKGYLAYSKGVTGTIPMRSAGLYSPVLRQLLIWNLPNRQAIMQTVRHEGLHQYIDRVMPSPARWFNEGHAEYFEAARAKGSWKLGIIRKDHLRAIGQRERMPLEAFMNQNAYTFLRNARYNYALSWLLVHYLHHTGAKHKAILNRLFEYYVAGKAHGLVWELATEGVDMKKFEAGLWEHFKKLGGIHRALPKPDNERYGQ